MAIPTSRDAKSQQSPPRTDASVLGSTTHVVGRVSGHGAIRVEGSLRGDLAVDGPAELAAGGAIQGNVTAASLDLAGSLVGDADVAGNIVVRSGAEARGRLAGAEVSIEPGAQVLVTLGTRFELELDI